MNDHKNDDADDAEVEPGWFAGVDWSSREHQVRLLDEHGKTLGECKFAHSGEALQQLCDWLLGKTGAEAESIAVAIETSQGPVVEVLLERGFQVYAINPKQLDRFRDRFRPAGSKDDDLDAWVQADSLRTDRHCFRRLQIQNPLVIELREWSRLAQQLQQERNALANRLQQQLWRYYPQLLGVSQDVTAGWFLELWSWAPTPAKGARLRESSVAKFLKSHGVRQIDAATLLARLRQKPVQLSAGTAEAARAHAGTLLPRLKLLNQQLKEAHRRLDELTTALGQQDENATGQQGEQRDVAILRSCPGAGRIVIASLLGEAWEPLQQRDYPAVRALSGVAPVTRRSGKSCLVSRRHGANPHLAETLYHWSQRAMQYDPHSKAYYHALRRRGHSHGRALRSLGDRLLAMACAMLRQQTLFDPDRPRGPKPAAAARGEKRHPSVRPQRTIPPSRPGPCRSAARRRRQGCPLAGTGEAGAKRP